MINSTCRKSKQVQSQNFLHKFYTRRSENLNGSTLFCDYLASSHKTAKPLGTQGVFVIFRWIAGCVNFAEFRESWGIIFILPFIF
ncbi:hypothetical protein SAMN05421736_105265 [Evansella caseinilytica]|uniref:Uncharacterized protein n=1 Tax=Evansella caseinilytica TaxID=1503961 RepID=A0A1H3PX98_9BACI|nr:hypothetical protein SAMN05421736_105265 [Evansella caseinilytica]